MAKKKAEAVEGRYELPSKKSSPLFEDMAEEYLRYYHANRRPHLWNGTRWHSEHSSRFWAGSA